MRNYLVGQAKLLEEDGDLDPVRGLGGVYQ